MKKVSRKLPLFSLFIGLLTGFSPGESLDLVKHVFFSGLTVSDGRIKGGSDVWGYAAPDGSEYGLMGVLAGMAIVKVPSGEIIEVVAGPTGGDPNYTRDIKVYKNYAYMVGDLNGGSRQGMMIIDLSPLPNKTRFVKAIRVNDPNASTPEYRAHNMTIDTVSGLAFLTGNNRNKVEHVSVFDLKDPENPAFLTNFSPVNGPYKPHDLYARNGKLWVAENVADHFSVWNVSDPLNPSLITRIDVVCSDNADGLCHNIWPTDNDMGFITTEESENHTVKFWDMTNSSNVTKVADFLGTGGMAHNIHVMGKYGFLSHFKDGIYVLDISDLSNPIQVAHYDAYPDKNQSWYQTKLYTGIWGVFPNLPSGHVLTGGHEGYLSILKFTGTNSIEKRSPSPNGEQVSLRIHPNPFRPRTSISFNVENPGRIHVSIYNTHGKKVRQLFRGQRSPGPFSIAWDGQDVWGNPLAQGPYLIELVLPGRRLTQRAMLLR